MVNYHNEQRNSKLIKLYFVSKI